MIKLLSTALFYCLPELSIPTYRVECSNLNRP